MRCSVTNVGRSPQVIYDVGGKAHTIAPNSNPKTIDLVKEDYERFSGLQASGHVGLAITLLQHEVREEEPKPRKPEALSVDEMPVRDLLNTADSLGFNDLKKEATKHLGQLKPRIKKAEILEALEILADQRGE